MLVVIAGNADADLDAQSEYRMTHSNHPIYQHPAYQKRRAAFLSNLQVCASSEARVRATAKAFVTATISRECTSDMVLSNDKVQAFLDDIPPATNMAIDNAKRHIKFLLNSSQVLVQKKKRVEEDPAAQPVPASRKASRDLITPQNAAGTGSQWAAVSLSASQTAPAALSAAGVTDGTASATGATPTRAATSPIAMMSASGLTKQPTSPPLSPNHALVVGSAPAADPLAGFFSPASKSDRGAYAAAPLTPPDLTSMSLPSSPAILPVPPNSTALSPADGTAGSMSLGAASSTSSAWAATGSIPQAAVPNALRLPPRPTSKAEIVRKQEQIKSLRRAFSLNQSYRKNKAKVVMYVDKDNLVVAATEDQTLLGDDEKKPISMRSLDRRPSSSGLEVDTQSQSPTHPAPIVTSSSSPSTQKRVFFRSTTKIPDDLLSPRTRAVRLGI